MKNAKTKQKFTSLIVALALMLTLIPAGIATVSAVGNTSKFLAPIELPIAGSIPISTAAELAAIGDDSDSLSKNYHLINDIDLSTWNGGEWTPIGYDYGTSYSWDFTGTFDGQGYVIKNLTITGNYITYEGYTNEYAGLFGRIDGATIKNVGLEGTNIDISSSSDFAYAGGICGCSDRGYTISNCYNTGDVSASVSSVYFSGASAGGIYGYSNIIYSDSIISNCYNTGDVSASVSSVYFSGASAGGICGEGSMAISNCYNTGDISASGYGYVNAHAGGICGDPAGSISNCHNTGDVSAYSYSSSAYAGGICGEPGGSISNCYNTGDVSASVSGSYVYEDALAGGICGIIGGGNISDCYNTGDVSAVGSINAYAGGICGIIARDMNGYSDSTISKCYNMGDVYAYADDGSYAGGICGFGGGMGATINDCYNTGDVSAFGPHYFGCAGGICGDTYNSIIRNCYATGDVSAGSSNGDAYAGGVCGIGYTVNMCYWNSDNTNVNGLGSGDGTTTPLTTAQMKIKSSFVGFDFIDVWEIDEGNDYPQLRPYTPPPPATYTVTVSSEGTGATGNGSYEQGDMVSISAGTAPTGQQFKNWTTTDGGVTLANANSASTSFTMPANAVTVTANF